MLKVHDSLRFCTGALLLALLFLTLPACSRSDRSGDAIAVSIPPQQYLLSAIVGSDYKILTLLPPDADPETYDPSVAHLMEMQHALLYFKLGMIGFEEASIEKIRENFPMLRIIDTSKGVEYIKGTHPGASLNRDPHIWTSVRVADRIACNMKDALVQLNPAHKDAYENNYRSLSGRLAQIDDSIKRVLAPHRGEAFLIWHPSLSYFAADYGLRQLAVEPDAREVSPRQYRALVDSARKLKPKVLFYEKEHGPAKSQALARELGIPAVEISLLGYDWADNLLHIANVFDSISSH